jgi:type II secretion system protein D
MKLLNIKRARTGMPRVVTTLICGLLLYASAATLSAQVRIIRGVGDMPPTMPTPPSGGDSSGPKPDSKGGGPWVPSEPLASAEGTNNSGTNSDDITLSFQGANIDMVVQWLAETTGKTVVKHPQVQCQLTITSSKKVSHREAINIVYRALALEGFTAIETTKSILLVPADKEPRMSPEVVDSSKKEIPEGRQRLTKVFSLTHIQAASLKEKVQAALSDKATVNLDEHANQIIISDYNDNIRVVGELIAALDTDRPEDVAVRIISLKHMAAVDLAKELAPLYQKMSGKGSGTVDVAADERSNSLIILSSESDFNALQRIISGLDTADAQEKITKTFVLKNADAQDVAKQLQDLAQGQDNNNNRYPYYIFSSDSSNSKAGKKMSVVADRRRNALVIQAPPAEMNGIATMIAELDEPVPDDSLAPKIFHLKYVSAVDMEDVLNELFLKKQQTRSYYDYIFGDGGDNSGSAGQDAGRLYGKVRITSEPYSNTILVTSNSKENLAVVEDVLRQLDAPSEAGESTLHVPLMFAKASVVARNVNILFAKNGSPPLRASAQQPQNNNNGNAFNQGQQQSQSDSAQNAFQLAQEIKEEGYYPWLGGQPDNARGGSGDRNSPRPVSDLVGRVRAVADERGNALLISANVHYFPQVLKLISELDAPSDQVLIEARIVEVSSDYMDKLGVRWSPDGSKVFTADDYDNSFLIHGSGKYTKGFGGNTIVNNSAGAAAGAGLLPANLLAQMRSGVVESTINIDFLVQFLKKNTDATVLGEPQININDNETGRLFVGQQVPILTGQNNPAIGGNSQNFTYKDVGVILEVTPHINSTGDVELKVHAESSTVVAGAVVFGSAVFDTRNFQTDLTAKNGQTLVLGGIHQRQISDTLHKTPILGDIPIVGWAFKKKDKSTHDVELMVFLHPRVVHDAKSADRLLEEINQKMPKMRKWDQDSAPKPAPQKQPSTD